MVALAVAGDFLRLWAEVGASGMDTPADAAAGLRRSATVERQRREQVEHVVLRRHTQRLGGNARAFFTETLFDETHGPLRCEDVQIASADFVLRGFAVRLVRWSGEVEVHG